MGSRVLIGIVALSWSVWAAPCASCHRAEATVQPQTSMGRALERVAECEILRTHAELTFQSGEYSYRIVRKGEASIYTVSNGKETLTVPIAWAFGLGAAGQTYVFQNNGHWYESRVSFFRETNGLDRTLGAVTSPANLEEAAGRLMSVKDANECFQCHATNALSGGHVDTEKLTPGIQCDRCHAASETHAASFQTKSPSLGGMRKLSNMSADEASNFCGQCHRTWDQIAANGPYGINNVRFQPYRLTNSKCYDPTDARISCVACHDPHGHVRTDVASYDVKCQSCHGMGEHAKAKLCPVGKHDCSSCHMPQLLLPGSHNRFTDHQIRIVQANEKYPN